MISLACQRIKDQKLISGIKVLVLSLLFVITFIIFAGTSKFKNQLNNRTYQTQLIVGAEQDKLTLMKNILFFKPTNENFMKVGDLSKLKCQSIPIISNYSVKENPLVGTTVDYFKYRNLSCEKGDFFQRTGEVVLGAKVSKILVIKPGDALFSSVKKPFNVSTAIPVKLHVKGILNENNSPDDFAIFTSLKTAWTVEGIGHAHDEGKEDVQDFTDLSQVSPKNLHFHGEEDNFPISGAILIPKNAQQKAELQTTESLNIFTPISVQNEVLNNLSGLEKFLKLLLVLTLIALTLALSISVILSLHLRRKEKENLFALGFTKEWFYRLVAAEWMILICASALVGWLFSLMSSPIVENYIKSITGFN